MRIRKSYIKPSFETVELRVDERLAASTHCKEYWSIVWGTGCKEEYWTDLSS